MQAALFISCIADLSYADLGEATVKVLCRAGEDKIDAIGEGKFGKPK